MSREVIETSQFFSQMEEYGFFDHVEAHLPDNFTLIYEIARILEDLTHDLSRALAPILELQEPTDRDSTLQSILIPLVTEVKEYEADLIRSVTEVRQIYPYQFLLPETVFLQRLAERSLWMPRPRQPHNFRYQTESDRFAPDDRKQKVYVLFDTSSSMRLHYRILLAKSIAYLFLKRNEQELGTVFCRTFDLTVGELHVARDVPSFQRLISTVMHLDATGNGTVLQKALQQAIDDISHESQLSHAQILVITDGVAHIDLDGLRSQMGDTITVNTVKIGHARMVVDDKIIEDQVYHSNSEDAIRLRELLQQKHEYEVSLSSASGGMRTQSLKSQLSIVVKQIETLKQRIAADVTKQYGLEIQKLSTVYVEVDDIDPKEMFSFPEDKVRELEELAGALLQELRDEHQVEDIKRAAMLYDHLYLLMQYNTIDAPRLERYAQELEQMLGQILNRPGTSADDVSISDSERSQIRNMLQGGIGANNFSLARLLRMLAMRLRRWWRTRRQFLLFRKISGKVLRRRG